MSESCLKIFKASPYSLYVLFVLFLTFMLDQLDRYALPITSIPTAKELKYGDQSCMHLSNQSSDWAPVCATYTSNRDLCDSVVSNSTDERICQYDYNGQGIEYQLVSGPIFTLVFTCTGVIISIFADNFRNKRPIILACCLIWWSVATLLTGFVYEFWQLAILRFSLGIGQAGCNPIATSLIADYFSFELRGSALSIYYWGIYTGYSLSYIIGNGIMKHLSWRWVYRICGLPGFLVALLIVITIRQKNSKTIKGENADGIESAEIEKMKFKHTLKEFLKPSLISLCIAGSIRMAAGDVWAYNNNTYFKFIGQTTTEISKYLGIIPMAFGVIGSFLGGFFSDRIAKKADPSMRIWVLVISQIIAAPFVTGVLYLDPPYCYYSMIPTYIFGEMWIGVCLSVVVELVPERLRITGIGVYFFVITNIGGNMQVLVPVVQDFFASTFNLATLQAFRGALYVFYPGEYILGSLLFLITLLVIKRDLRKMNKLSQLKYEQEEKCADSSSSSDTEGKTNYFN